MNNFGHRNELRHYTEARRTERMDSVIAKVSGIVLIVLLAVQLLEKLA